MFNEETKTIYHTKIETIFIFF